MLNVSIGRCAILRSYVKSYSNSSRSSSYTKTSCSNAMLYISSGCKFTTASARRNMPSFVTNHPHHYHLGVGGVMHMSTSISSLRERLLAKINNRHDVPLEILIYPGSRVLSIHRPDDNNILNQHVLDRIADRVSVYDTNHAISAIFFTSYTPDHFSSGLDLPSMISSEQRIQILRAANILTKTVMGSTKSTIGVFGGDIDSIAFAVFGFSKYRLGTQKTRFQIADLINDGRLPLGSRMIMLDDEDDDYDGYDDDDQK